MRESRRKTESGKRLVAANIAAGLAALFLLIALVLPQTSAYAETADYRAATANAAEQASEYGMAYAYSPWRAPNWQQRGPYTVWFDGTMGLGTERSLVQGARNDSQKVYGNTVTLPTSSGYNNKYHLKGWYDIYAKRHYAPGQTVSVTRNTVFYADWVQADYDLAPSGTLVSNQPDSASFVHTDMFDYNELFNLQHGAILNNDSNVGDWSHKEVWKDQGGNSYLFTNWYNTAFSGESLGFPRDVTKNRNGYTSENGGHTITKDIVTSRNDQLVKDLFTTSSVPGREYLGQGKKLFQYDESGTTESRGFGKGYYYYDSDYNGADYNRSQQRFYVYKDKQWIQRQEWDGNRQRWNNSGDKIPGFMPLEQGEVAEKSGQTNYWLGMKTDVDFFLPDDVGSNGGKCNKSAANKDMRFYFSGDDDVWVFVDDQKVLDLGGIHGRIAGDINFSTGVIRYENADNPHAAPLEIDNQTLKKIKSGNHKLTIYYLERGSSLSNCSIYFNLAPRYNLDILKTDAVNNAKLRDAEFSIYADERCTIPAQLWKSEADCKDNKPTQNVFRTDGNGKISCYGLVANRTYYLKETDAPPEYPSVADKVIKLTLDATGNASLGTQDELVSLSSSGGAQKLTLNVKNKKLEKTSVQVVKKWFHEDGSEMQNGKPDSIKVELYRSAYEQGSGGSGARVPIRFSSQYFGYGNSPVNYDTAPLVEGNYQFNAMATSGGKVEFELEATGKDGARNVGFYSVTANGKTLQPVVLERSSENCYIGGRWEQYPPRKAKYTIDPIIDGTEVKITLIGYPGYAPGTGNVSTNHTIKMKNFEATEPQGGNPGTEPSPPSTMPADAELVKDAGVENPAVLNEQNHWTKLWEDLPTRDASGKVYYYYVKEVRTGAILEYSTSYTGNGVLNGTIQVNNVRVRSIAIKKKWLNPNGSEMEEKPDIPVDAVLIQIDESDYNRTKEFRVRLNKANGWRKEWRRDSSELGEKKGHKYKYKVKEISAIDGYEIAYENNNGVEEGEIAIVNRQQLYKLPSAGGMGTYLFNIVGAGLITVATALHLERRKRNKAEA